MGRHAPLLVCLALLLTDGGCRKAGSNVVVVYVSEDQVFSEAILRDFERETGIRVRAVYDTEEAKSTGVMNRLMAEKGNPQADVYWANEPIRAEVLRQKGLTAPYASPNAEGIAADFRDPDGHWTGFSARARVLVVRKGATRPTGIRDYADARWKGRAVMAHPLFGTTTTTVSALFTVWGDDPAKAFLGDMRRNAVRISTSNGESEEIVAKGEADFALVDSDDAANDVKHGKPVEMIYPDQEDGGLGCLIVPNAVMLVRGAPHAANGQKLIDYLLSRETERKLAAADCAQIPLHAGIETPAHVRRIESLRTMKVRYADVARKMQEIQPFLREWAGG